MHRTSAILSAAHLLLLGCDVPPSSATLDADADVDADIDALGDRA